jgi:putative transposase
MPRFQNIPLACGNTQRQTSQAVRRVQTCRHELLNPTLIWNQHHLFHALREFEQHDDSQQPHQGIANARPLHALPL